MPLPPLYEQIPDFRRTSVDATYGNTMSGPPKLFGGFGEMIIPFQDNQFQGTQVWGVFMQTLGIEPWKRNIPNYHC